MSDMKTMNDKKLDLLTSTLPNENKEIASQQAEQAEAFFEDLKKEATEVNEHVNKLRERVVNHHAQGPGRSFLKAPLRVYEKALPTLDLDALEKVFAVDIETCKSIAERVDEGRD